MKTISKWLFATIIAFTLTGCGDDDSITPISVNFENAEVGFSGGEATVNIIFSRAASQDGEVAITVNDGSLAYGTDNDYSTTPSIVDNTLILPYQSGDDQITFIVTEGTSLNIPEDATVIFTITAQPTLFALGENISSSIVFSENFITPEATVSANVGGSLRANQAYINLSDGTTTSVSKDAYDLILESSGSDFNILLNYSSKMMALNTGKSILSEVNEADIAGITWRGDMHMDIANDQEVSLGDFSETKFYQWDANASTSNVFIINRGEKDKNGTERGIKKVQITKSGDTYSIKSADLDGSNEKEHTITKSQDHTFKFMHFEDGDVDVEPTSWDISIRTGGQAAFFGDGTYFATYNTLGAFQNHYGGVKVAVINTDTNEFDNIAKSDAVSAISNIDSDLSAIAFDWRSLNFSTFQYEITDGVTYIIMDADGNYFKLKFTNYYNASNEEEPQVYYEHLR